MSLKIRLFISDVDGTILNPHKELSPATVTAVRRLQDAGIQFALISARPVQGMKWLIDALGVRAVCAGFNGGLIVNQDISVVEEHDLHESSVPALEGIIRQHKLDLWVYTRDRWFVPRLDAYHVQHDAQTVRFQPEIFPGFDHLGPKEIVKLVGISEDFDAVEACEQSVKAQFGDSISATRSQLQYLGITHSLANKGSAVEAIAAALNVPLKQVATIGDADNDIQMFQKGGVSIAMGQSMPEVRRAAVSTTLSNTDDGVAWDIDKLILGPSIE
ncbi:MAG: Cof-type HAD-IIB family hydrolase [Acidobacteriaceae bacterium]